MKKLLYIPLILLLLSACDEVNNLVDINPPKGPADILVMDTTFANASTPAVQPKNVLIEDFTAVKCDNCPNAQNKSVAIENANPGRVAVLGIHCTDLGIPYPGRPDFRTKNGDNLVTYLVGAPSTLPTGDVDRKVYSGNASILMGYALWKNYVDSELATHPIANLDLGGKFYDAATRTMNIKIMATFTQSSGEPYYISAALTESGFKDIQLTTTGVNDTFTFQHTMRKLMSPYNGIRITDAPVKGTTYQVKLSTVIDKSWNVDNCRIVAFVHKRGGAGKNDVEQVTETTIK